MALPLGKLTILVGAGIVGSILAKEGRLSDVSGFFSSALKIALKQSRKDDNSPSNAKLRNDSLLAQVHSLREELQLLASNRPVTIVTSSISGRRYGVVIVIVVVGYGYVRWKGWKLPDMMFATRRSLSDACNTMAKQLEAVYTSIAATKRHLSSRMDRVDCSLDECSEVTATTKKEISELRGDVEVIGVDFKNVHQAVLTLETKINRIEGKQVQTATGVCKLLNFAYSMENVSDDRGARDSIQEGPSSSSKAAIEFPEMTPSRTGSLPLALSSEPPSPPASNGSHKVKRPLQGIVSSSGLKDIRGMADVVEAPSSHVETNGKRVTEEANDESSINGRFLQKLPSIGASLLTRTRSLVPTFK